jgi:hypothetical protein
MCIILITETFDCQTTEQLHETGTNFVIKGSALQVVNRDKYSCHDTVAFVPNFRLEPLA